MEVDDRLPYLDIMIIRKRNGIVTDWYKKDISTDMTLSYLSNHPNRMKENVVFNLFTELCRLATHNFMAQTSIK